VEGEEPRLKPFYITILPYYQIVKVGMKVTEMLPNVAPLFPMMFPFVTEVLRIGALTGDSFAVCYSSFFFSCYSLHQSFRSLDFA
jgi:hypothetical protein